MAVKMILLLACLSTAQASWWLLAMPSTAILPRPGDNFREECEASPLLVTKQRQLCALSPNMLLYVSQGAQMGIRECQRQFRGRHWNCSTETRKKRSRSLRSSDADIVFGGSLSIKSREKAYVHAISAAGVAYSITRACTLGNLSSCACDRQVHRRNHRGLDKYLEESAFEWGGCSEDVEYGVELGNEFVDAGDLEVHRLDQETRLMNLHNNHAGTKAVRRAVDLQCKCHGVSGSCSTRVCWRRLGNFNKVGRRLLRKFDDAVRVELLKPSPARHTRSLLPEPRLAALSHERAGEAPRKQDLVYTEESPNYCNPDRARGIRGTAGRRCEEKSSGAESCGILCCGRGHRTEIVETVEDCNCHFVWCCQVQCDSCRKSELAHFCR